MTDLVTLRTNFIIGVEYFGAAATAIMLTRLNDGVALLWFANALLIARLVRLPTRNWRIPIALTFIASILATVLFGPLGLIAPLLALANVGEAVVAAFLLKHFVGEGDLFGSMPKVFATALIAGVIAPLSSALIGASVVAYWLNRDVFVLGLDWIVGHGLGTVICLPLLTCIGSLDSGIEGRTSRIEIILLLALVAGVTALAFGQSRFPILFLPILPILIVTFRLGGLGVGFAMILLALIGGYFTLQGSSPISLIVGNASLQLQFFQFYLGVTFLIALPIAGELARRRELAVALRDSETKYRFIVENTTDIVLDVAIDGTIRYASPSIRQIGGFDPEQLVGRNAIDLVDPDDVPLIRSAHLAALADPSRPFTVEHRAWRADGYRRWFETHTRAALGPDGKVSGVISALRDIHARKHAEQLLAEAAATDPLTGVANRRTFDRRLDTLLSSGDADAYATMAMIDLDHFKAINDSHGHGAGDNVLQAVAAIVRKHIRATDLVARIGGEEFAILFEGADIEAARVVCERLRRSLETQPIRVTAHGKPLFVTASIGLAAIVSGQSSNDVARAADRALYEAKAAGRNCLKIAA